MMDADWTALSGAYGNYQRGIYDNISRIRRHEYLIHSAFPPFDLGGVDLLMGLFLVTFSMNSCRLSIFVFSTKGGIFCLA